MESLDEPFSQLSAPLSRRGSDAYSSLSAASSSDSPSRSRSTMLADPFDGKDTFDTPAMPTTSNKNASEVVLGQFSSTPAIQTTVVTTTTTTTTSFPPLFLKAPKHLHDLDPEMYPLAASPTPPSLKLIKFDVNGRTTVFTEAENAEETYKEFEQKQKRLRDSNGSIRSVAKFNTSAKLSSSDFLERPLHIDRQTGEYNHRSMGTSSRSFLNSEITPPSSGAIKSRQQKTVDKPRRTSGRQQQSAKSTEFPRPSRSSSKLQIVQTSTPVTPFAEVRNSNGNRDAEQNNKTRSTTVSPGVEEPEIDDIPHEVAQTLSPQPESNLQSLEHSDQLARETSLSTPPVESVNAPRTGGSPSRPRPFALDTTAAQDASLPSPSLSPVTAAATLQSRRSYFDEAHRKDGTADRRSRRKMKGLGLWHGETLENSHGFAAEDSDDEQLSEFSTADIPNMLDSFEALPTEMKSYVMYQLLRRCPKPVLHCVADAVNPALKCDFLTLLPLELSQLIIGNLDVRSLCRASQVSKKWRQIVDSDEKTWKSLFDHEGFALAPGELRRAILEGWGWQHTSSMGGSERDLGNFGSIVDGDSPAASGVITLSSNSASDERHIEGTVNPSRRSKRKAVTKVRNMSRKAQKRKENITQELALYDADALNRHLETAEGPFAAAKAAKIAVPSSDQGLSSLRSMKLHKSIYRRHHLISQNWMQDEIKPRHLAFRAHSRHVVTCLEFDADKILTGSDDTNINVYDTRTGALRARLTGHEGGVWALKYEGNMLVSGSTDRSVRVWDIETGECVHVFHGHTSTVRCLLIVKPTVIGKTADGKPIMMPKEPLIITGSRDSTLRVWTLPRQGDESTGMSVSNSNPITNDNESPYFVRQLVGHGHSVRAIAAHGDTLVSGSYDHDVRVWKISSGETLHRLRGHTQKVYSVVLDHERNRCISGSMDNFVKIWSLDTGNVLYNLDGHASLVGLLDLQRDRLVSAAADSTLRIWDPHNGHCKAILSAHTGAITCFQHDGHKVISGSDHSLKMWDIKTGALVRDLLKELSGVWQVKFDERRCVAAVQRSNLTYIEILDFGASRDGLAASHRGKRVVVDSEGVEMMEPRDLDEQIEAEV